MPFFTREYQWMAYVGSIISSIIGFYVLGKLLKRYKTRKTKVLRYVVGMMACLAFAAFVDFFAFTIDRTNVLDPNLNDRLNPIGLGSAISFSLNAVANIYILLFDKNVFRSKKKTQWMNVVIIAELVVVFGLITSTYTSLEIVYFTLIHVLCSLIIFVVLALDSHLLKQRLVKDKGGHTAESRALQMISYSGIVFIVAISSFVLHEVFLMTDLLQEYWTVALGWILASLGGFLLYLGYVIPDWIRKRWEKRI